MKRSLKDISPVITSHAVGEKRVLLSRDESGCGITQIAVTDLRAGEVALAHIHPDMQEGFYVLSGELDVYLDNASAAERNQPLHCHKDDFVYVQSGTAHELHAITNVRVMTIGCEIESKRNLLYPLVFKPNLHSTVWGGSRIKPWKQMPADDTPIGESWDVSAVPSSPSVVDNGCWAGKSLIEVNNNLIQELFDKAAVCDRKRMNYDLRTSSEDKSQRMLNALMPGTVVPIHRHPNSNENVLLLRGKLVEILFDDEGNETARYMLDPSVGNFGCVVPAGVWHTVEVLEPSVLYEAKDGAYGEDGSETFDPLKKLKHDITYLIGMERQSGSMDAISPLYVSRMLNVPIEEVEKAMREMGF